AIRLDAKSTIFLQKRGELYMQIEELELALADYNKMAAINPKDPEAFIGRGQVFYRKGNFKRAKEEYSQAQRLEPNSGSTEITQTERIQSAITTCQQDLVSFSNAGAPRYDPLVIIGACTQYLQEKFPDTKQNALMYAQRARGLKLVGD